MRKLVLFIFLLISEVAFSQVFEGVVLYSNSYESKLTRFSSEQLNVMMGRVQEYFIKNENYKSVTNGQVLSMQIYNGSTNRIYNKVPGSDTLYWFSASLNTDTVMGYEIKHDADTVLGNLCSALILKTKSGTSTFYYSKSYLLDAKKYVDHHYGHWSLLASKTGALPLKIVIDNAQFKMESIAVELKPSKLDIDLFLIKPGMPTKRSG